MDETKDYGRRIGNLDSRIDALQIGNLKNKVTTLELREGRSKEQLDKLADSVREIKNQLDTIDSSVVELDSLRDGQIANLFRRIEEIVSQDGAKEVNCRQCGKLMKVGAWRCMSTKAKGMFCSNRCMTNSEAYEEAYSEVPIAESQPIGVALEPSKIVGYDANGEPIHICKVVASGSGGVTTRAEVIDECIDEMRASQANRMGDVQSGLLAESEAEEAIEDIEYCVGLLEAIK